MKIIFLLISFLSACSSVSGGSLSDQVRNAEVVAFVSIPAIASITLTNSGGSVITNFSGEAVVERAFKGVLPEKIWLKDETAESILARHGHLGTTRFLVFLKRSGAFYTPARKDDLAPVWGDAQGNGGVVWCSICMSGDKAIAIIQKALKN